MVFKPFRNLPRLSKINRNLIVMLRDSSSSPLGKGQSQYYVTSIIEFEIGMEIQGTISGDKRTYTPQELHDLARETEEIHIDTFRRNIPAKTVETLAIPALQKFLGILENQYPDNKAIDQVQMRIKRLQRYVKKGYSSEQEAIAA